MRTLMTTVGVLLILAGLVQVWNGLSQGLRDDSGRDRIHQTVSLRVGM